MRLRIEVHSRYSTGTGCNAGGRKGATVGVSTGNWGCDVDVWGERLRCWRRHRGLTQRCLAQRVGVSRNTVSRWETGEILPPLAQVFDAARVLRITPGALLDIDPPCSR